MLLSSETLNLIEILYNIDPDYLFDIEKKNDNLCGEIFNFGNSIVENLINRPLKSKAFI